VDLVAFDGAMIELLPEGRVRLENDHEVLADTAGKMRRRRIRAMVGDRVTVEMAPYDTGRGRITYRHRTDSVRPGGGARPRYRRR
jgi:translation initiation factor IF-1